VTWRRLPVRRSTFETRGRLRIPGLAGSPFAIATGGSYTRPPTDLLVQIKAGLPVAIFALEPVSGRIAKLWPRYSKTIAHGGRQFQAIAAVSAAEVNAACALLARAHPQGASRHGMLISLYEEFADGSRALVGVTQLGEYFHTHFPGRAQFGRPILGKGYAAITRGDVVKSIPITAAKRFALRKKDRGNGLGEILAREALLVAGNYRWPPAGVVEVSRHMAARKFFDTCCGTSRDFLSRSGYVPVPLAKWLRHGTLNHRIAVELTDRPVPGYYYADVRSAKRPVSIKRALEAFE
jgi:hypothetical protein